MITHRHSRYFFVRSLLQIEDGFALVPPIFCQDRGPAPLAPLTLRLPTVPPRGPDPPIQHPSKNSLGPTPIPENLRDRLVK